MAVVLKREPAAGRIGFHRGGAGVAVRLGDRRLPDTGTPSTVARFRSETIGARFCFSDRAMTQVTFVSSQPAARLLKVNVASPAASDAGTKRR